LDCRVLAHSFAKKLVRVCLIGRDRVNFIQILCPTGFVLTTLTALDESVEKHCFILLGILLLFYQLRLDLLLLLLFLIQKVQLLHEHLLPITLIVGMELLFVYVYDNVGPDHRDFIGKTI